MPNYKVHVSKNVAFKKYIFHPNLVDYGCGTHRYKGLTVFTQ